MKKNRKPVARKIKKQTARPRAKSKSVAKQVTVKQVAVKKPPRPVGRVLYLYGIARGSKKAPHAAGVDGAATVEAVPCAGFACWVSRVDAHEFGERLEQNIENLDWLAEASVRHQRVVAELSAGDTVLPARFGTVFLSEKTLSADVAGRKKDLAAALERLADTDEWGVKVYQTEAAPVAVSADSGRDYLQQKAAMLKPSAAPQLAEEVKQLAQSLAKIAADAVSGGKVSGGQRGLEWQASFLVRRSDRKKWDEVLAKYAQRWAEQRRIEITGPWPPYSFVSPHGR